MPKDLPGLYWDPEKNRYFPISSRRPNHSSASSPKPPTFQNAPAVATAPSDNPRKASGPFEVTPKLAMKRRLGRKNLANLNRIMLSSSWNWTDSERIRQCVKLNNIAETSKVAHWEIATLGRATTFCTYPNKPEDHFTGSRWHLLGDSMGWISRCSTPQGILEPETDTDAYGHAVASRSGAGENPPSHWLPWTTELNLQPSGHITSMSMSGSRWVAAGSGKTPRLVFSDIQRLDQMCILTLPKVRDLWTSHLLGEELALGASTRGVYLPSVDHSSSVEFLHTDNDVLSITQDAHLIYTGSRNGTIHRFDKRIGFKHRGQALLEGRFNNRGHQKGQRSPVLKLELMANHSTFAAGILDSGLFISHMNGDLQLFDLRRLSSSANNIEPSIQYHGHINSYKQDLGLAFDIDNGLVYAAGLDCRIRGWNLMSGEPLDPAQSAETTRYTATLNIAQYRANPFIAQFDDPIEALQVTPATYSDKNSGDDIHAIEGTCLWAASGRDLWKWNLGQRGIPSATPWPRR
ncbi:hypothetical protein CC1G_09039 [Coprinopsis cinerea okayama7|uniref:WD40 repeat-like protein n=1 Tax=Coprinopsis cinerea (strain Okayama-7 / 130 / ATCC MYA-4618 / FGSC 9003) TaxID=240176 RepID=A8N9K4_COPC7|nr:hypothetical protein CC1G_09039 [Coprinopsis cinerea okayama7\|eukprot:XP_001831510.2 hypothetical protein CC1G_09039 [Coprinopsis cinerea okayama7\